MINKLRELYGYEHRKPWVLIAITAPPIIHSTIYSIQYIDSVHCEIDEATDGRRTVWIVLSHDAALGIYALHSRLQRQCMLLPPLVHCVLLVLIFKIIT